MSDMAEMMISAPLERYQPVADRHGFGKEWRRMCEEPTDDSFRAAYVAARLAGTMAAMAALALQRRIARGDRVPDA